MGRERDTVWLGARATEANLKALSREGKLARHRVLHFATHGLLAGESEAILNAKAEPALMLTPPKDGATPAELEQDDGLLTASEVAQLELDADWVVLPRATRRPARRRCRGAVRVGARLFLCQGPRAARLALVRELGCRCETDNQSVRRAQSRSQDRQGRSAATLDG